MQKTAFFTWKFRRFALAPSQTSLPMTQGDTPITHHTPSSHSTSVLFSVNWHSGGARPWTIICITSQFVNVYIQRLSQCCWCKSDVIWVWTHCHRYEPSALQPPKPGTLSHSTSVRPATLKLSNADWKHFYFVNHNSIPIPTTLLADWHSSWFYLLHVF